MRFLGILLLCIAAYFGWRFIVRGEPLVLVSQPSAKPVTASLKAVTPNQIVLQIASPSKAGNITEVKLDRSLASRCGLSPPTGFKEELLQVSESEKNDKESVAFVESFNKDTVRWIGSFAVLPDANTDFVIPATSTVGLSGTVSLQYEAKSGLGGSINLLRVSLTPPSGA